MRRLAAAAPLLAARAAAGRVRRCHGDLHLGNLCLLAGPPVTPFDALEFDEALATIDTGYDLAFLLMDLEHRLGRPAANRVLNRYVARSGDAGLVGALPLWLSLRAHDPRACRGAAAGGADEAVATCAAPQMTTCARRRPGWWRSAACRAPARPVWPAPWRPGCGAAPGALVLRTDEIRKRRAGVPPETATAAETPMPPRASAAVFAELCGDRDRGAPRRPCRDGGCRLSATRRSGAPSRRRPRRGRRALHRLLADRAAAGADAHGSRRGGAMPRTPMRRWWPPPPPAIPGPVQWERLDAAADPAPAARARLDGG